MTFYKKIIWQIIPHLIGWGALILVVLLQNDLSGWEFEDYYTLAVFFGSLGVAAYLNLYVLFPRFLFRNKYWQYAGYVLLLVLVMALFTTYILSDIDHIDWISRFIVNSINFVFFLLLTSSSKLLIEYLQKITKLKEIENKQLKDELSLLKAQVHPHFLFNTLNNLYGLITTNQNREASEITLKLADLMRYLLESSKSDKVCLRKEILFLENYLILEKIRLSNKKDIKFEVSGLDKDVFIAPLLFIPLVENAFKHGLITISANGFAHFLMSLQGSDLFFEAKNSIDPNSDTPIQSGTGLDNLRKRLQLIYPEKHQLVIEKSESFFQITLHLQL